MSGRLAGGRPQSWGYSPFGALLGDTSSQASPSPGPGLRSLRWSAASLPTRSSLGPAAVRVPLSPTAVLLCRGSLGPSPGGNYSPEALVQEESSAGRARRVGAACRGRPRSGAVGLEGRWAIGSHRGLRPIIGSFTAAASSQTLPFDRPGLHTVGVSRGHRCPCPRGWSRSSAREG